MKKLLLVIFCSFFLSGCASFANNSDTLSVVYTKCPALKKYTKDQLMQAAKELRSMASDSQIAVMITDYSKLRDACRVADDKMKRQLKKQNGKT